MYFTKKSWRRGPGKREASTAPWGGLSAKDMGEDVVAPGWRCWIRLRSMRRGSESAIPAMEKRKIAVVIAGRTKKEDILFWYSPALKREEAKRGVGGLVRLRKRTEFGPGKERFLIGVGKREDKRENKVSVLGLLQREKKSLLRSGGGKRRREKLEVALRRERRIEKKRNQATIGRKGTEDFR